MKNPIRTIDCMRCGTRHEVEFKPLLNPGAFNPFDTFAMCEITGQPILASKDFGRVGEPFGLVGGPLPTRADFHEELRRRGLLERFPNLETAFNSSK